MHPTPETTHTIELLDCPACKNSVLAYLTYEVNVKERVYGEHEKRSLIERTATANLTLTGVRFRHECQKV